MWFSSFRCRFACIFMCSIEHWGEGHWQKSNRDNVRRVQITKLLRCVDIPLKWLRQVPAATTCLSQSRRNSATHNSKKEKSKQTKQNKTKQTNKKKTNSSTRKIQQLWKKKKRVRRTSFPYFFFCLVSLTIFRFDVQYEEKKKMKGGVEKKKNKKKWE